MTTHRRAAELAAAAIDFPLSDREQAELSTHLDACDACRALAASLRSDASRVQALPAYRPSDRVLGRILADGRARRSSGGRPFAVLAATALLTVALLGTALIGAELTRPRLTPSPFVTPPPTPSLIAGPTPSPSAPIASPAPQPTGTASPGPLSPSPAPVSPTPSSSPSPAPTLGPVTGWRTLLALDETSGIQDVAVTDDGYVAVGFRYVGEPGVGRSAPTVWLSADGVSWEAQAIADAAVGPLSAVAAAPDGTLVAAALPATDGGPGALLTSADGRDWTRLETGELLTDASIRALIPFGEQVLAVGSIRTDIASTAAIWRGTARGTAWEPVDALPDEREGLVLTAGAVGATGVVVSGEDVSSDQPRGFLWRSEDGVAWESLRAGLESGPHVARGVAALGDRIVVAGNTPGDPGDPIDWQESDNRVTAWTTTAAGGGAPARTVLPGQVGTRALRDLVAVDGVLYALGAGETAIVWRSVDGRTWEPSGALETGEGGIGAAVVIARGDALLVLGSRIWSAVR